jgi:CubicO group peptidase (beta-lactamase class C family)
MPVAFRAARRLIESAVQAHAFPAASVEAGREAGPVWREAFGRLTYDPAAAVCRPDTIFDLASLTKVIVTASLAMRHVSSGLTGLDARVGDRVSEWRGADRRDVTIRHLLDHSSGLPGHARLWEQAQGRDAYTRAIAAMPLERAPGSAAMYSDLGFILLGVILERAAGSSLDRQFAPIAEELDAELIFRPGEPLRPRIAPTEKDVWRGRLLVGEAHDENAAALGGVAAHAGLFGTAPAVGAFARLVLATFQRETALGMPALMREFAARSQVPGSSRALAWDTMLPTSSCGARLSSSAIGHTGFTGTSLWIDPEQDLYVVFLTNRVHPTRQNDAIRTVRPMLHETIVESMGDP